MTFTKDITIYDVPINATNGEVMKVMFKLKDVQIVKRQYTVHIYPLGKNQTASISISREFWDSPYKGVSE